MNNDPSGRDPDATLREAKTDRDPTYDGGRETAGVDALVVPPDELSTTLDVGARIGRFAILGELGRGGMGTVVSAYDTELERRVAIKVLRPDLLDSAGASVARIRMLREARAMAKVAHPNVVTVYEADEVGANVYIVMEQVDGGTLRDWLADEDRGMHEIVDAFLQAGRGLVAAHDAGIVHRDFKPANVLFESKTGRMLVTDFGIAGEVIRTTADELTTSADSRSSAEKVTLTRTGALLGTPIYMAPEQHRGAPTDARSDQFSFCVSLYEALHAQRPFAGSSHNEIRANVTSGTRASITRKNRVPPRVQRALDRGLQIAPHDRYASMRELLHDLTRARASRRRYWYLAVAAAMVVASVSVIAWTTRDRGAASCTTGASHLEGVWDPDRKAHIGAAFHDTNLPHADAMFGRASERIDAWTTAWIQMRDASCAATNVSGTQSPELLDRRTLCLDRALDDLHAITTLWVTNTDSEIVDRAIESAASLPALDRCADTESLLAELPYPDDEQERATITAIDRELSEVSALFSAGRREASYELAKALSERAEATDYPPLLARTRHQLANSLLLSGGLPEIGEQLLDSALEAAAAAKSDYMTAMIWCDLIGAVAYKLNRPDDALAMRRAAELAVRRAGDPPALRKRYLVNLSMALNDAGDSAEAITIGRQALELLHDEQPKDADSLTRVYSMIAYALMHQQQYDAARAHLALSIEYADTLSPDHPRLITSLSVLGELEYHAGHPERSLEHLQRAMRIAEATWGMTSLETATVATTLGIIYAVLGRHEDARGALERAMSIARDVAGTHSVAYTLALENRADVDADVGDYAAASERYAAVLEIRAGNREGTESTAPLELTLATVELERGKLTEARDRVDSAVTVIAQTVGTSHELYPRALVVRGQVEAAARQFGDALADFEQARSLYGAIDGSDPINATEIDVRIAALHADAGQFAKAIELARRALPILEAAVGPDASELVGALVALARGLLGTGDAAAAIATAERALAIQIAAVGRDPAILAGIELLLARALWQDDTDRERSAKLADSARARYQAAGARAASRLKDADSWIRDHRR